MNVPDSAVRQVAALKAGEAYSRARFLPSPARPRDIREAKGKLTHLLSPVIARAQKLSFIDYQLSTIHAFTADFDVVVAAVVVRRPDL